jgi:hypothetical protein
MPVMLFKETKYFLNTKAATEQSQYWMIGQAGYSGFLKDVIENFYLCKAHGYTCSHTITFCTEQLYYGNMGNSSTRYFQGADPATGHS